MGALNLVIRPGVASDLAAVAAIQQACPEAAHWSPADYLEHEVLVAVVGNSVGGFLVCRRTACGERELLNLAVSPDLRRQGLARALFETAFIGFKGDVFLEVRESNTAAQAFYNSMGFQVVARRQNYYEYPPEAAIVMKFHSC
jgi:ribosomal-protein-alanine N-acetyltransferase